MANIKRTGRKKSKGRAKIIILTVIFVLSLGIYFAWNFFHTEKEFVVYTSMEEPSLPVVYAYAYGQEINAMHGYLQDLGNEAASDCMTVLPQDRRLELRIAQYGNVIAGISYEIHSLDLSHFIEKTEVDAFETDGDSLYVRLPIQNLIEKGKPYLLKLSLDTGEKTVHYYTRIIWTDQDNARQMIDFAKNFAAKTFDYEAARELTTYLETNETESNDDLGTVTLHSSFSQLTWGASGMQLATDISVRLKELDGIMGAVELHYMTTRDNEYGAKERYEVVEEYTMRMGAERIYLMDYTRKTDQIFDGRKQSFSGNQIDLGIANAPLLSLEQSENGQFIAFTANRELWSYDQKRKHATNVFSFRSGQDDGTRANYDQHGIKILSVSDGGDIDFVVYGYMNRGRHEGYNGIAYYQYSPQGDVLTERFFIPQNRTFEKIALEIRELCTKNENDMFYVKQNDAISAIGLRSLEMLDIASSLTDGSYAVSYDQRHIAWQDGPLYAAQSIKYMDLASGNTQTLTAGSGEYLRVLGMMENDLVYGKARAGDDWILSSCIKGLPVYRLEIVSDRLDLLKDYQREGSYIDEVRIDGNRIHLTLVRKNETEDINHAYLPDGSDTIIYQKETDTDALSGIKSGQSEGRKKVYYIPLTEEIRSTGSLRITAPRRISYENAGSIALLHGGKEEETLQFYAYANGRLALKTTEFDKAVNAAYDGFGWVKDEDGRILYNRTDQDSYARQTMPNEEAEAFSAHLSDFNGSRRYDDGWILLNAQDLTLSQMLYYVYRGAPTAAYLEDGKYLLICGYDNFNIRFYDPEEGETFLMGREDAERYLSEHQNDFVCGIHVQE